MRILSTMLMAALVMTVSAGVAMADHGKLSHKKVQEVQQALADGGFYRYGVDGLWGPYTDSAIRSFQDAKGLPVTGRLDKETFQKLNVPITDDAQLTRNKKLGKFN